MVRRRPLLLTSNLLERGEEEALWLRIYDMDLISRVTTLLISLNLLVGVGETNTVHPL